MKLTFSFHFLCFNVACLLMLSCDVLCQSCSLLGSISRESYLFIIFFLLFKYILFKMDLLTCLSKSICGRLQFGEMTSNTVHRTILPYFCLQKLLWSLQNFLGNLVLFNLVKFTNLVPFISTLGGSILGVKFLDPLAGVIVSGMILKAGLEAGYQRYVFNFTMAISALFTLFLAMDFQCAIWTVKL